ncbi:hypothetical protein [Pleionea sp. CnH1-48]|uniref:hypothetical protein n=1 Tax=Pleionea sp. CnH1-48 TaxID=2954494 RepID=UPI002097E5C4|nr:hypothetical protein [Pleionea sp. CnH1-48]MCO7224146.1 hypothetical protein [Pleionea sp. CnH1-48]
MMQLDPPILKTTNSITSLPDIQQTTKSELNDDSLSQDQETHLSSLASKRNKTKVYQGERKWVKACETASDVLSLGGGKKSTFGKIVRNLSPWISTALVGVGAALCFTGIGAAVGGPMILAGAALGAVNSARNMLDLTVQNEQAKEVGGHVPLYKTRMALNAVSMGLCLVPVVGSVTGAAGSAVLNSIDPLKNGSELVKSLVSSAGQLQDIAPKFGKDTQWSDIEKLDSSKLHFRVDVDKDLLWRGELPKHERHLSDEEINEKYIQTHIHHTKYDKNPDVPGNEEDGTIVYVNRQMLEKLREQQDAGAKVSICSTGGWHREHIKQVLETGLPDKYQLNIEEVDTWETVKTSQSGIPGVKKANSKQVHVNNFDKDGRLNILLDDRSMQRRTFMYSVNPVTEFGMKEKV